MCECSLRRRWPPPLGLKPRGTRLAFFQWSRWGVDNGLHSVLTQALALSSQIEETLRSGAPLVRPLFWHAPGDPAALTIDDQFLLGERLLVAPVLRPGQRTRDVYLPAGRWRDWWSGNIVEGPRRIDQYPAPLETLPLFERAERDGG